MAITVTEENRATWVARLAEAETAQHKLMMGVAVVELAFDGETVKYTATTENKLMRYINEIKYALGQIKRPRAAARQIVFK